MLSGPDWNFIHVPKCGGMALRQCLEGKEVGDLMPMETAYAVRSQLHRIPRVRPNGRVFTVIRHPAEWLRSYWLDQSPQRVGAKRFLHRFWSNDLDRFVANVCFGHPGYVTALYRAHIRYKKVRVFRLEGGLARVLKWLDVEVQEVPEVNLSPPGPRLSKRSRRLVYRTERPMFRAFGYKP